MKKLIILLSFIALNASLFSASRVIFSQNFESPTLAVVETMSGVDKIDEIGGVRLIQFGWPGGAKWLPTLETMYPIAGNQSLRVELASSTYYWEYQLHFEARNNGWSVKAGMTYKLTFKMATSVPNDIPMVLQNGQGLYESVNLHFAGNDKVETFTYTSNVITKDDAETYYAIMWGTPAAPCVFTIDDIKIEEIGTFSAVNELKATPIKAYSSEGLLFVESVEDCKIDVLNLMGQTLISQQIVSNKKQSIQLPVSTGCVLVKNTDAQGRINTQKVILR